MNGKCSVVMRSFLVSLLACVAWPAMGDPPAAGPDPGSNPTASVLPSRFTLTLKDGFSRLVDDTQTINNHNWSFDSPRSVFDFYSIEGEGWIGPNKNLSIGGEFMHYESRFKRVDAPTVNHTMKVRTWLVKSKYYYGSANAAWRPYLGGGVGVIDVTDSSGPIGGNTDGSSWQAVAGMQWRSERIGVRAEYIYLLANVRDESDQKVNASMQGLFLGVSFYFGSAR